MTQLKEEIVKRIKDEPILFGLVSDALKVKPSSMAYILNNRTNRLIEYPVIKVIIEFTGLEESQVIMEVEPVPA